jgi:hypothetical protein
MKALLSGLSRRRLPVLAALLAATVAAPAAVIHVDFAGLPQAIPNTLDGLYLNAATGTFSTASIPPAGWDINVYNNGSGLSFFAPAAPGGQGTLTSGAAALSLLAGASIGSAGLYQAGLSSGSGFLTAGIRFAGFKFYNEISGSDQFAWLKLSTSTGNGFPAALLGYAYEDEGASIIAGQVPEPAAPALLGFTLLATMRRRRAPQASA